MSSTNRGGYRMADDFYATPTWAVDAVLRRLLMPGLRILEPSAGRGAIVRALIAHGADPALITAVEPHESRHAALADLVPVTFNCGFEAFADNRDTRFDLVVMNPPFSLAESHIRLACSLLAPGGRVAALLRLAFLAEGQERADLRRLYPHDRLELVKRPSFTAEMLAWTTDAELLAMATDDDRAEAYKRAEKKRAKPMTPDQRLISVVRARLSQTDSCAYAWGIFGNGCGGRFWTHEESA